MYKLRQKYNILKLWKIKSGSEGTYNCKCPYLKRKKKVSSQ